jgi:hypothetical protein
MTCIDNTKLKCASDISKKEPGPVSCSQHQKPCSGPYLDCVAHQVDEHLADPARVPQQQLRHCFLNKPSQLQILLSRPASGASE